MKIPHDQWQKWLAGHSTEVRHRIDRLNPGGCEEGCYPRGWHPHKRSVRWNCLTISVGLFVAKYGSGAYRALPKAAFIRDGHRKSLSPQELMQAGYL